eukprot:gnl/TRDRNA2_/TRDRNA2_155584_c0_seq1.p1 gnl/TRDRNA2_/TRDRNA2_155584_c0~~gnl/TRDRNA2_/TRDRNA2_155584_c0_seq1.p1  ORF type:complete len:491 (+),score=120.88 gnl/TRDRNA2_/TRDRNA2_155584_c0_seq1:61-1533(+)
MLHRKGSLDLQSSADGLPAPTVSMQKDGTGFTVGSKSSSLGSVDVALHSQMAEYARDIANLKMDIARLQSCSQLGSTSAPPSDLDISYETSRSDAASPRRARSMALNAKSAFDAVANEARDRNNALQQVEARILSEVKDMKTNVIDFVLRAVEERVDNKLSETAEEWQNKILALRQLVSQQNAILDTGLATERCARDEQRNAVKAALECLEASLRTEMAVVSEEQKKLRQRLAASPTGESVWPTDISQLQEEVRSFKELLPLLQKDHGETVSTLVGKLEELETSVRGLETHVIEVSASHASALAAGLANEKASRDETYGALLASIDDWTKDLTKSKSSIQELEMKVHKDTARLSTQQEVGIAALVDVFKEQKDEIDKRLVFLEEQHVQQLQGNDRHGSVQALQARISLESQPATVKQRRLPDEVNASPSAGEADEVQDAVLEQLVRREVDKLSEVLGQLADDDPLKVPLQQEVNRYLERAAHLKDRLRKQ